MNKEAKNKKGCPLLTLPLLFLAGLFLFSCGGKKGQTAENARNKETKPAYVPAFNGDSAYAYVEKQVSFGPRVPGTKAHEQCALYLEKTIKAFIPDVIIQQAKVRTYDDKTLNIKNIIATFHPERTDRILLCAHWDCRPFADHDPVPANRTKAVPGANDAASGAGVLLEIARQLKMNDPGIGVDLVFLDAEDWGQPEDARPQKEDTWCLGTQYWAGNPHKPGYTARFGILLDMVGARNTVFPKEGESISFAPDVVNMVWETAARLGYADFFPNQNGGSVTDDHIYINNILKIPTIDIIPQDMTGQHSFFPFWHTSKDDMESIDRNTLQAVGNTLLAVLAQQKAS
ncbi:MAG: M28 family peptidase [Bacteroidetes bacterium]|nr:M28 family peptidase [Bacteroidota bacterium]